MAKSGKPPTFRGSDFAMRWQQGQWSEERILQGLNASDDFRAIPYGRTGIGPLDKDRIAEYWEEYSAIEHVGKRPDLLAFTREDFERLTPLIEELGDTTLCSDDELRPLLDVAICGIEAENSLWVGAKMPDYPKHEITRLNFVAPTVIVKDEDAAPLSEWQEHLDIPICVVHVFFDRAYIIELSEILDRVAAIRALEARLTASGEDAKAVRKASQTLQKQSGVVLTEQSYTDSRTGTGPKKLIYRTHYRQASLFGELDPNDPPREVPKVMREDNGKIIPFVAFEGGSLVLSPDGLRLLAKLRDRRLR